jgi:hypothetical protein
MKTEDVNMTMKDTWKWISFGLFILGLIFSVIGGLWFNTSNWIAMALAIIGLIIGIIYAVSAKEIKILLLASIALLAMTAAFSPITVLDIGDKIRFILVDFAALVAPIALISAVKALIVLGLEK